jgi:hypothetical protein
MRKIEFAHIGRTAVGFQTDQFFNIEGLALCCELFRLGLCRLFKRKAR